MALKEMPGRLAESDDIQETITWLRGMGTLQVSPNILRHLAECIGPQRPHGVYWSGYWRETFTVIGLDVQPNGTWAITVKWHGDAQCANPSPAGRTSTHYTAWNMQRDRIVRQADEPEEVCNSFFVTAGRDPSSTECDLKPGHAEEYHEGPDPFGSNERVRWKGGGSCAGDRLPVTDVQWISGR